MVISSSWFFFILSFSVGIVLTKSEPRVEKEGVKDCKANFDVITQNTKGLRDKIKRKTVFEHLKTLGGICFLQETHGTKDIETPWKGEWGGEVYFSNGASNARGVMILFPSGFEVNVSETMTDNEGRIIILICTIQNTNYLLYNIYAPNNKSDHKSFLEKLQDMLSDVNSDKYDYVIGGGDWNFTDDDSDRSGGNYNIWQENSTILEEINEKLDTIDIWRTRHPDKKRFTFRQKKGRNIIQSRLDRLYISDTLQYNVAKADISPSIRSDHSRVSISIRPIDDKHQTGSNFWKFNNSLLKNKEYTVGLRNYLHNNVKSECKEISNKQVRWEYTKFKIKTWTIIMSKKIAAARRKEEQDLDNQINVLEEKLSEYPTQHLYNTLHETKMKLEKVHAHKTQSLMVQSRIQHYEEGEKSSAFFLNQIKQNKRKSTIRKLIINDKEISEQDKIMSELKSYYSNLYSNTSKCSTGDWIKKLKQDDLIPQLSSEKSAILSKEVTIEQFEETIKNCAKNKSPGNDGLTQEFYEYFWGEIKETFYESFIESKKVKKLTTSQRQNIISLLEKNGKDKTYIKNWRPISLINFDTKLISKLYAERLKKVMPDLVHPNQVAYVKGRFIGEGTRVIEESMHFTKKYKLNAYAVAIDFEKAFDSVDWQYMWETLEAFNIPNEFIDAIKLIYNDIESCVMNNGKSTPYFKIKRGVRQGDPIAAYLFTLAIELLAIKIRNNENITGIEINDIIIKLSMYADDITGIVIGKRSIKELMTLLDTFKLVSGLGVNIDKTEIMCLGTSQKNDDNLIKMGYKIVEDMKITGVVFSYNSEIFLNKNFRGTLINIDKMLNIWKQRNLSLLGKIQIIKTFGISKVLFITNMINIPPHYITDINKIFYKFVWNGIDKIKRKNIISDIGEGGAKMPDLQSIIETQKIIWAKRYAQDNYHPWKEFMTLDLTKIGGDDILNRKIPQKCIQNSKLSNFNKDILLTFEKYKEYPTLPIEIGNQYLWRNDYIKTPNNTTIEYTLLKKAGINYVKDLIIDEKILSLNMVKLKCKTNLEEFNLKSVIKCLPQKWKLTKFYHISNKEFIESHTNKLNSITSKKVYKEKIKNISEAPTSESFFTYKLGIHQEDFKEYYSVPFLATVYTKLRSFQFKINHNILYTNEKLFRVGIKQTNKCNICKEETETLTHLFITCKKVETLWKKVEANILSPFGIDSLSEADILLGLKPSEKVNPIVNHIILETKYYIYVSSLREEPPNYQHLKSRLKVTESIEENIAYKKGKLEKHLFKWYHLINYVLD